MARPQATPEQRRAQRQRIYNAAAELFATRGPGSVTVRAVAEHAGISQGTLYSHYDSLGELLRELWAVPVAEASRELEHLAAETSDPIERIRRLLEAFAQFVFDRPDVHRGAMLFVRPLGQETPDRFPPDQLAFFRLLTEALDEATADGTIDIDDSNETAELLWAAIHGALSLPTNADIYEFSAPKEIAERMIDFLVASLRS